MKYKIVHIEDNTGDTILLKHALELYDCNHEVFVITDGGEALDILFEGSGVKTDLFIIDLNLPRINGLDILEKLKKIEKYKNTPVIILTSSSNPDDIETSRKIGANFYFIKPSDFTEYKKVVTIICSYL